MFLAGGTCFLLLGQLSSLRINPAMKAVLGAAVITGVELTAGLLINRDYSVWDYRALPANLMGQICLQFSLLWMPLALLAMGLYGVLEQKLPR